jgi:hypothetical protein
VLNERAGSIASYSLIIIGLFWILFGTSATICQNNCTSSRTGGLVPIFEALIPFPGTWVIRADFAWNLVGVLLMSLGLLSYKYTRERIVPHPGIRKVAIVGAAIILFSGIFMLNTALESQYIYCYLPGAVHYPRFDCANIFNFPGVLFGAVTMILGSISFTAGTLTSISIALPRERLPVT